MQNFVVFLVIQLLVWLSAALNGGHSFTVNEVARARQDQFLDVPTIFTRNLLRYGGVVPSGVVRSAETASVLAFAHNQEFLIPVSVGAATLQLSIDTGSSDLWIFSRALSQDRKEGHTVYKPSVYSSKVPSKTWAIRYADGSFANGDVYYDVVGVEGIWVMQQAVEVATDVSNDLAHNAGLDGVLGIGFSNLNKVKPERENTWFENAKSQLDLPLFAAGLKQNGIGTYDFGFINQSKYIGELNYVDVDNSHGHWSFKVSGYDLGSGKTTNEALDGVIDTGASLIFLPDHIVRGYYKQVIGAETSVQFGAWTVPCSSTPPMFTTIIKDYKAVVPGKFLRLDPIMPGSSQCLGGIQSNLNASVSIFGHVFLKEKYVVFDDRGPRLGFATQT